MGLKLHIISQTVLILLLFCFKSHATIVFDSISRNPNGTVSVNGTLRTIIWIGGTGDYISHIPVESTWNSTFFDWTNPQFITSLLYQFSAATSVAAFEANEDDTYIPGYYVIIRYEQTLFDIDLALLAALRMTTNCYNNQYNDASMSTVTITANVVFGDGTMLTLLRILRQSNSFLFGQDMSDPKSEAQGNMLSSGASHAFLAQALIDLDIMYGWMNVAFIFDQTTREIALASLFISKMELANMTVVTQQGVTEDTVDDRMDVVLASRVRIIHLLFQTISEGEYIVQSAFDHGMIDPYVYIIYKQASSRPWMDPLFKAIFDGGFNYEEEFLDVSSHYLPLWLRAQAHDAQLVLHQPAGIVHVSLLHEITFYYGAFFAMQGYHYFLRPGGYQDQCRSIVVTPEICADLTTTLSNKVCCSLNTTLVNSLQLLDRHPVSLIARLQGNITTTPSPDGHRAQLRTDGSGNARVRLFNYNAEAAAWIQIGLYRETNVYSLFLPVGFRGGSTTAPLDMPIREIKRASIATYAFVIVTILSGLSICVSIGLIVFNNVYRNRKVVWLTSPNMNNVILLGAIGFFVCAILLGLDRTLLGGDKNKFLALCTARTWLVQLSFSLLFGSLVAKIYRVYKVFTSAARCKTSRISDKQLFIVLNTILFVNVVLLLAWTFTDTIKSDETQSRFETDANDKNLEVSNIVEVCSSTLRAGWLVAFIIWDFCLLFVGAVLSYKTRNVAIEILKNAKDIGFAIYTSSLIAILVIPILNSVNSPDIGYLIAGFGIVAGTNAVLVALFKGPILAIWKNEEEQVTKLDMNSLRSSQGTGESTELQTTDMPDNTVPSMDTDTTTTTTTDTTTA